MPPIIVYYVSRLSSRYLYEDAECNVRAEGEDGKTVSEYKQLDCLGTYDTLSEIGKRKREFICQGAEVKLRLIIVRTCTCGVISHLYRNKLDVAERVDGGLAGEGSVGRSPPPPRRGSRGGDPFGGFLCRSSRYNKVQLYCHFAGRQRALSLPISDKRYYKFNLYFYLK